MSTQQPRIRRCLAALFAVALVVSFATPYLQFAGVAAAASTDVGLFHDGFESEVANQGIPNNWEHVTDPQGNGISSTINYQEVTTARSYTGSQSYFANETDPTTNSVFIRPEEQQFTGTTTANVSIALNRPNTDNEADGSGGGIVGVLLMEGTGDSAQIDVAVENGELRYINASGTKKTLTTEPGYDEWIKLTIYQINATSDTYAVKWQTEGGQSGTKTGLEMNAPMTDGFNNTIFSIDDAGYIDSFAIGKTNHINGTVRNQHGTAVANASVLIQGVNYENIDSSNLESRAKELLNNLSDPTPPSWNPNLSVAEDIFEGADAPIAAVTTGTVNGDPWFDSADLRTPQAKVKAGKKLTVTSWKPSKESPIELNEYDSQQVGVAVDTPVVFKKLAPGGDTVDKIVVRMNKTAGGGLVDPSSLEYGTVVLSDGYYKVYPKGSPASAYPIKVGHPVETYLTNLRNINGSLTDRAQAIRSNITQNVFKQKVVKTGSNGQFSAELGPNVKTVSVTAYKAGGKLGPHANVSDIRDVARGGYNGSFVITKRPEVVTVPAESASIQVYEFQTPDFYNLSRYQQFNQFFKDWLRNHSVSDLPRTLQQQLGLVDKSTLVKTYNELAGLIRNNQQLRNAVQQRMGQDDVLLTSPDDASRQKLTRHIKAYHAAISSVSTTKQVKETTKQVTNQNVTMSWLVPGNIPSKSAVSLTMHLSNGTSKPVQSKYIELEDAVDIRPAPSVEATRVRLVDYPLPNGSAVATFSMTTVTQNGGVAKSTKKVKNPEFDGNIPSIRGIDFSTLRPGPSERVTMDLSPEEGARYAELKNVTVWHNGSKIGATVTGPKSAAFTTDGSGEYTVYSTFTNHGGHEFEVVTTLSAGSTDYEMPSSVRISSTPVGTVALSGDGLAGADVELQTGGSKTAVTAYVTNGSQVPSDIRVYSADASLPPTVTFTNTLKYTNGTAVPTHVRYYTHLPSLGQDALVYSNGRPVPQDEQVRYANVSKQSDQWVVMGVSGGNGKLTLKTHADPGYIDQIEFWIDEQVPEDVNVPFYGMLTAPTGTVAASASDSATSATA